MAAEGVQVDEPSPYCRMARVGFEPARHIVMRVRSRDQHSQSLTWRANLIRRQFRALICSASQSSSPIRSLAQLVKRIVTFASC